MVRRTLIDVGRLHDKNPEQLRELQLYKKVKAQIAFRGVDAYLQEIQDRKKPGLAEL
jgi:hypothetical protein